MVYRTHFSTRETPQVAPIPGREQDMVRNEAGGYVFAVDDWKRLDRFLILGAEGGTYYVGERRLTIENAQAAQRCIVAEGDRVVKRVVEISEGGNAPQNDPALFVLAMCAGLGDEMTRRTALAALPRVARIGTHLFHFVNFVEGFRGWGRGLRKAVAAWYNEKPVERVAYQALKYQQRDGWSHRDALRLAHPNPGDDASRKHLYKWIVGRGSRVDWPAADIGAGGPLEMAYAFEDLKSAPTRKAAIHYIENYGLTREMIPNELLNHADVWAALSVKMPLTATLRNLGKMTQVGLIRPMSQEALTVAQRLTAQDYIRKSRLHPLTILVALKTYAQGQGMKGKLTWTPVREVVDALDEAFYLAFDNVAATGKRLLIGVDVSGSMMGSTIAGTPLKAREAAAAWSLVAARSEERFHIVGYDTAVYPKALGPRVRLDDLVKRFGFNAGETDCAVPILYAAQEGIEVDVFITITDNDTWYGSIHPVQALNHYREQMNIAAKLVTVGMTSSGFTIADPQDGGMLDVVGFDTATPQVVSEFARSD